MVSAPKSRPSFSVACISRWRYTTWLFGHFAISVRSSSEYVEQLNLSYRSDYENEDVSIFGHLSQIVMESSVRDCKVVASGKDAFVCVRVCALSVVLTRATLCVKSVGRINFPLLDCSFECSVHVLYSSVCVCACLK